MNELESICKEVIVADFKALFHHLRFEGNEDKTADREGGG